MGIAFAVILLPACVIYGSQFRTISSWQLVLSLLSGMFLAVHFSAWIYSLEYTSVAISVVLVNTSPLWVGLLAPLVTSDRLSKATTWGLVVSILGLTAFGYGYEQSTTTNNDLLGGALATLGAFGLAGYLLIGRTLGQSLPLGIYVTICYGAAALCLWFGVLTTGQEVTGFSRSTWLCLVGMAVISQVVGHTCNICALKYATASIIALVLLCEPIIASCFAYLLFGEFLSIPQFIGAALILGGIFVAITNGRQNKLR